MRGKFITTTLISITQTSFALVNLKDASLVKTWIDFDGSKYHTALVLERTYSSRSLSRGIFGFGWCSNLDLRLDVVSPDEIAIDRCTERSIYWRRGEKWVDPTRPSEILEKAGKDYVLIKDGTRLSFEGQGRLLGWENRLGKVKISYRNDKIDKLEDPIRKWALRFSYRANHLEIALPHNHKLAYEISGDDLETVHVDGRLRTRFTYDEDHNLTEIFDQNHQREIYTYDREKDQLISFQRKDGCIEIYDYRGTSLNLVSEAIESCQGRRRALAHNEFIFRKNRTGGLYLERLRTRASGSSFEIQFDPISGEVVSAGGPDAKDP